MVYILFYIPYLIEYFDSVRTDGSLFEPGVAVVRKTSDLEYIVDF